ncbi:NADP-dependent oxidoreductase domain-containing protein [Scheffersomyces xylosifermentans]|uniref:NADP-dependent oxidoreductase domain-containing protein n=1 Tax=Scheffersomyces xylosifermentans TaxID=1304137 RepID=UPI00315C5A2A
MSTPQNSTKEYTLYTGQTIPAVGLGTWQSTNEEAYEAVLNAIKAGYKHIDTAACYGNEEPVGRAIRDSGIPRSELFVTTKIWGTDHTRPKQALQTSLDKLGLDYVDLYLMHWPVPLNPNGNHALFPTLPDGNRDISQDWDFIKTYDLMQDLIPEGKVKAIGVSNFSLTNLKKLLDAPTTKIKPALNQVELHPLLPQPELVKFAKANDIVMAAYSPLGSTSSPLLKDETIVKIAEKYQASPATILISWALWRGTVVLPKSVSSKRIQTNLKTITLEDEDGETLNNIHKVKGNTRFVLPNWFPFVVFDEIV